MPGGEKRTTTCTKVRQKRRGKHFNTPRTPQATELIATTTILTVDDMCNVTYTEHGDQAEAGNYRTGISKEPVDYLSSCGLVSASFHKTSIRIVRGGHRPYQAYVLSRGPKAAWLPPLTRCITHRAVNREHRWPTGTVAINSCGSRLLPLGQQKRRFRSLTSLAVVLRCRSTCFAGIAPLTLSARLPAYDAHLPPRYSPYGPHRGNSWLLSFWGKAQTGYNRPEMAPKWSDLGPPTSGQVHWG